MSRSIFLASLCLCLQGTSAFAIDLELRSTLSETIEVNDNYFLSSAPKAATVAPTSTIAVNALGRTPTMLYTLSGDFSYYKYLGPGAESTTITGGTRSGVTFGVEQSGKLSGDKTNFNASWRQQDLVSTQLADTGVASGSGQSTTTTVGGGITRQLSPRDTLSWFATGSSVEFSSAGSSPYVNLDNIGSWRHRLNPNNDIITLADFSWTVRDDQAKSETKFMRLMTGLDSKITQRLSFTANVGAGIFNTSQNNTAAPPVVTPVSIFGTSGSGSAVGLLWDMLLAYRIQSTTRISLSAAQSAAPDILGNYSLRKTMGVTLDHDINSRSSLQFSGQFTNYTSTSGTYDYFTATVNYNYQLAREWRGSVSYIFRERNQVTSVNSNGVMLVISHDATILPR